MCSFIDIYSTLCSLILDLWSGIFCYLRKIHCHYFFKHFFSSSYFIPIQYILEIIWYYLSQQPNALSPFFFSLFLFPLCISVWVILLFCFKITNSLLNCAKSIGKPVEGILHIWYSVFVFIYFFLWLLYLITLLIWSYILSFNFFQ